MNEPNHPTFEQLLDLAEGRAAARARRALEAHVAACAACRARLDAHAEFRRVLEAGDAGDAPRAWIERAARLAAPRAGVAAPDAAAVDAFLATILFDSAVDSLAGVRSAGSSGRQYMLASGEVRLELSVEPAEAGARWPVSGQVLLDDPALAAGGEALLFEGDDEVERVGATSHGEFLFSRRPSGTFRVRFLGRGWTVETPPLEP